MNHFNENLSDSDQELLAALAEEYDEALARGDTEIEFDLTALPTNLRPQVKELQACLVALNAACRHGLIGNATSTPRGSRSGSGLGSTGGLEAGQAIGRFQIVRELGRGGHGIVFEAIDTHLNRSVALKVPRPELLASEEMRERFLREAEAAGAIEHPNLVPVYEVGEDGPLGYIASVYCPGPTLAEWLKEHSQIPVREAARLVASLADGVAAAHRKGVLHRDIKPSNVLLDPRSELTVKRLDGSLDGPLQSFTPRLTDFGLAKLLESNDDRTRTGALLGTPAYMSPEQAEGRLKDIGPTTDVYGLGVLLYEILTGRPPFRGENDADTLRQVSIAEPLIPSRLRPGVPRDLEAICLKCLEHGSANRYASAMELACDLRRFLAGEPTAARPANALQRTWKWACRYPAAAALIGVSTAALIFISIGGWISYDRIRVARDVAESRRHDAEVSGAAAFASGQQNRRLNYVSTMALAWRAWEHDEFAEACRLLDRCLPGPSEEDLREFSWHHLWNLTHQFQSSLAGHVGDVYRATYSPDGEFIASCGQDQTVRVWNARTGTLKHVLRGHTAVAATDSGDVNSVAFSQDGKNIASAGEDSTVRIWDVETGNQRAVLQGHQGAAIAVAFSPDGELLATGGADARIVLWNTATWTARHALVHHTDNVEALAFSPDGSLLASASDDNSIKLWNPSTWDLIETLVPSGDGLVNCLAFSRDGKHLATGGRSDRRVRLWDLASRRELRDLAHTNDWVQSLAFCDGDRQLAIATKDGRLELTVVQDGTSRKMLGHENRVWCVETASNDKQLVTAGADGTIKTWNLGGTQVERSIADRGPLYAVAYAQDGRLCFGGEDPFSLQVLDPSDEGQAKQIGASQALMGDFDADGIDDRFWFHEGQWSIELAGDTTAPVQVLAFGAAGDVPIVGDWDGDGRTDLGVFRQGKFLLKATTAQGDVEIEFVLGDPSSVPLVADWDGDRCDEVGVINDNRVLIDLNLSGRPAEYQATLPDANAPAIVSRAARQGALDPEFGNKGVYSRRLPTSTEGTSMAIQADGRILASVNVGTKLPDGSPVSHVGLLRLNTDGTLDEHFRAGRVGDEHFVPDSQMHATDFFQQPDSKIVMLQEEWGRGEAPRCLLRRLHSDGALDTSFGPARDGIATVKYGPGAQRTPRMALQTDGKIIVVGSIPSPDLPYTQVALARFNADGSLDTSFGPDKTGVVLTAITQSADQAHCVCLLPDGTILIGGSSWDLWRGCALIVRYQADGTLDKSFAQAGKLELRSTRWNTCVFDLVAEESGDIIIAGNKNSEGMLARIDKSGTLDTSFGSMGWVGVPLSLQNDVFTRVALDSKQRIVVSGWSGLNETARLALLRFLPDGTLETDFRPEVYRHPELASGYHAAMDLTIDSADRPVITGYLYTGKQYNFLVGRFLADAAESHLEQSDATDPPDWPDTQKIQAALTTDVIERARARISGIAPPRPVRRLAISPRGDVVAACSSPDNFVRVLEVASGRELAVLHGHKAEVMSLAFSPDGQCLATAGRDAIIRIWDAETWKPRAVLAGHTLSVQAVAFSSDGRLLASAASDGARIWRCGDYQQVMQLADHTDLFCIAFSHDGRFLAAGGGDRIKLLDASTGQCIATLAGHTKAVRAIAFTPDGRTLGSCGDDGTSRLWDLLTYQELATLRSGEVLVQGIAFSPDGNELTSVAHTPLWHGELHLRNGRANVTVVRQPFGQ